MSYTFYSFRNRTEQDETQWTDQTFECLIGKFTRPTKLMGIKS